MKAKPKLKQFAGLILCLITCGLLFQNCSSGFQTINPNSLALPSTTSSTGLATPTPLPSVSPIATPTPIPAPSAAPTPDVTATPLTASPIVTTPVALKPIIQAAGLGCDQNQCIWATGLNFQSGCTVNLYDPSWKITGPLASIKPATCDVNGLSFSIPDAIRNSYKQILMNVTSADGSTWSDSVAVSIARIAQYSSLPADTVVQSADQILLEQTVQNFGPSIKQILIMADGRFFPKTQGSAMIRIRVDGITIGNASIIDWSASIHPAQHSFNAIGSVTISAGNHVVQLVGTNLNGVGSFIVGQGSNLSTFESSARRIQTATGSMDFGPFASSASAPPVFPVLKLAASVTGPAALLLSGRVYQGDRGGDAMVGISTDGTSCPSTNDQSWSVNDLYAGAEMQAPVFAHGFIPALATRTPAAIASVFPWTGLSATNPVSFKVGADTTFISVEQPHLLFEGYQTGFTLQTCAANAYQCVASTPRDYSASNSAIPSSVAPWPGCPAVGTKTVIASASITIPAGHDGLLAILAKTRVQADSHDGGGSVSMGLTIDGVDSGSISVQEIKQGAADSQRTMSSSFLSTADHRLSPGAHTIQVWFIGNGDFAHLAVNQDLPLLIFD